jgi:hypothetical protein
LPSRLSSIARADTVIVPDIEHVDRPVPAGVLRAIRWAADRGCAGGIDLQRRVRAAGNRSSRLRVMLGEGGDEILSGY